MAEVFRINLMIVIVLVFFFNICNKNIEKWLSENEMTPNAKKSHLVNIEGALKANLMGSPLEPVGSQRDLGFIVHQKLTGLKIVRYVPKRQ